VQKSKKNTNFFSNLILIFHNFDNKNIEIFKVQKIKIKYVSRDKLLFLSKNKIFFNFFFKYKLFLI
jgi:hypothetical protein